MERLIRSSIDGGSTVLGARTISFSPAMIEIYADLGLDFVWLDFEHMGPSPYSSKSFEHLTRTAEAAGIDLLVRLPSPDPTLVRKVLDTNIRSLLIPRIESADEIRKAIEAARFTYDGAPGNRGSGSGRANRWGGAGDGYATKEDQEIIVGAMIENEEAVENLDEILTVPELGFIYIGPSDLSISKGRPFEKSHEDVTDTIEYVRKKCQQASVPIGRNVGSAEQAHEALDNGYRLLRVGDDASAVRQSIGSRVERIDDR